MKKIKIWTNTSVLNQYNDGLNFTDKKTDADLILLGSRKINLKEFPNLRGIFRAGVGKDNVPTSECEAKGIVIKYPSEKTKHALYNETAAYSVSLALRMLYPSTSISLPWNKVHRSSLFQKIALVIGTGNIGSRVRDSFETLMEVRTFDLMQNKMEEFRPLVEQADIITLHIPNSPENKNFFDKATLGWMKDDAILVNTSRANLVCENSLYDELKKKRIKAAFDVFWEEPYQGKMIEFYPESFYMSPHIASSSKEFFLGCRKDLDIMISSMNYL
tara:strand:+ start:703 stop:1524 length:822 start_codon:yes stop_codon:yes gene_type:complete